MDLSGKTFVIVGGSSGMGKATAKLALRSGARVEIVGRSAEKLKMAATELGGDGVSTASLDMMDEPAVAAYFGKQQPKSIDALIVSASSAVHGAFADAKTDDVRGMFNSKFFGPFVVAREALPAMRDGSSITFFSGVLSRRPGRNGAGLAAVNAAVEALSRALALELGPRIRVNTVSPGMTRTDAYGGMDADARKAMFESVAETLPVRRIASADDIAEAAIYLATNAFTTGHVLDVDGGHMIG